MSTQHEKAWDDYWFDEQIFAFCSGYYIYMNDIFLSIANYFGLCWEMEFLQFKKIIISQKIKKSSKENKIDFI